MDFQWEPLAVGCWHVQPGDTVVRRGADVA
jgi:hypothetical protein